MRLFGGGNKDKFKHRKQPDHSEPVGIIYEPEPKRDMNPPKTRTHNKVEPEYVTILKEEYENLKRVEARVNKIIADTHTMMEDNQKLKFQISGHDDTVKNMQIGYIDKITQLEEQVLDLRSKLNEELNSKNSGMRDVKVELGREINRLEQEVNGLKAEARKKNSAIEGLNVEIRGLNDSVGAEGVDELREEIKELRSKLSTTDRIKEENVRLKGRIQDLMGEGTKSVEVKGEHTCKVCGHEAKTLQYLKVHVQRKKDAEHQAYLIELNEG